MARYLNTRGQPTLAIAVCDRCRDKMPIGKLKPDRNAPGLRVCDDCNDMFDPWRLPARAPDQVTVQYPRPDEALVVPPGDTYPDGVVTGEY